MKTIPVLRTATHPADMHQHLVLVPFTMVRPALDFAMVCDRCALLRCCARRGNGTVDSFGDGPYNCARGVWIPLEDYVSWHQEDTS